jgi:hypothetical protein
MKMLTATAPTITMALFGLENMKHVTRKPTRFRMKSAAIPLKAGVSTFYRQSLKYLNPTHTSEVISGSRNM